MTKRLRTFLRASLVTSSAVVLLAAGREAVTEVVSPEIVGDPLVDVTAREFEAFRLGLEDFLEVEDAGEGLGPVFNGRSCAECHSIPRIGGSGSILEMRAGRRLPDGSFEALGNGTLFQLFSIPTHEVQAQIPAEANVVALRKSLPLFGSGLVEAVPDATLVTLADPDDRDGDGVSGRAARVLDVASGEMRVGRFGWKAQQATLIAFGAEAYRDEMGITNELFPREACPQGVDCGRLAFIDPVPDPEDVPERATGLRGIDNFESFLRFLGPPGRGAITEQTERGAEVFLAIGCAACHTPTLETGAATSPALAYRRFHPYGDFLLHDIGTGDGIAQADAAPNEVRTAPLWGLRFRRPLLHDGRAGSLVEAIEAHDREGRASREAFHRLNDAERAALLAFLRSL